MRSRDRCWAAIRSSHRPEPSGRAVHGVVNWIKIGRQHGRRFVLLRHIHRPRRNLCPFLKARVETSGTGAGAVKLDPGCSLGGSHRGCGGRCQGWKCRVLQVCPSTPHSISDRPTAPHVCCCCQMNWWDVVRRVQMGVSIWGAVHLHSMGGWALSGADVQETWHGVQETWHGVLETAWLQCNDLSRLDAWDDWKVVHWCRTQAPVTAIRQASLMVGSIRRLWALPHQTGAQYSAAECTRTRLALHNVVVPAPQPEPASRLRSATRDVSFLGSCSRCRRYVSDQSNNTPRYLGSEQKGRISLLQLTFSSRLASLSRCKTPDTVFCSAEL